VKLVEYAHIPDPPSDSDLLPDPYYAMPIKEAINGKQRDYGAKD
jgi:hypothetical protein